MKNEITSFIKAVIEELNEFNVDSIEFDMNVNGNKINFTIMLEKRRV